MDPSLAPLINGALLAVFTVVLGLLGKGRFDALRDEVRSVKSDLSSFRSEVAAEFATIRTEMAIMRSDLTNVALTLGARQRPQTG